MFFFMATMAVGFAYSLYDSVFNNYLHSRFDLTGFWRSLMEFPRELPGLLVVFVSVIFSFLCSRRLAALSMLFSAAALLLLSLLTPAFAPFLLILFLYSVGQHIFLPLTSAIGMELSREGGDGRRLGQLNSLRNLAAVLGSLLVWVLFKFTPASFRHIFIIALGALLVAGLFLFLMRPTEKRKPEHFLKFRKRYSLFYILTVLYGCRKQIFITFAPWVLVSVFGKPVEMIAKLLFIGGLSGILFQPLLGLAVDRLGERFILAGEALLLILVCGGYALGSVFFGKETAFIIAAVCFIADQMLMSVGMARATYLKKIAVDPADVTPTLTLGVSMDHIPSILIAVTGGILWKLFGFRAVFGVGAVLSLVNFFFALRIRIPRKGAAA
jgi:predicted MFS family arabinose efflux permease